MTCALFDYLRVIPAAQFEKMKKGAKYAVGGPTEFGALFELLD